MASDIHRKRTGRGLKVSEEIVLKEEMYEEMEDDMPRSYKYLAAHLQTDSPELNNRVSAYLASQTAMATMAKYNEINKMFSEAFPRAASFSHQTQNSLYMAPLMNKRHSSPSIPVPATSPISPTSRHHSISTQSHSSATDRLMSDASLSHTPTTVTAPTPDLSPATTSSDVMDPASTPYQMPQSAFPDLPLDPQLTQQATSSFTSELPNEVKMMANIDVNDPMAIYFSGDGAQSAFAMSDKYCGGVTLMPQLDSGDLDDHSREKPLNEYCETFFPTLDTIPTEYPETIPPDIFGQLGTPGCGGPAADNWESFVDFDTEQ
ncbi:hypothetical protein O1611_g6621 [Lasiodiplodia mahajangana]|uniref:Uncharacterized protein n=1 Tax=Lasiodiplodia mahajangana TaxID=1108764 RepID=A0ACC2JHS8_9PEZI|nr:hypothetical protein O1611_g6621 [Lasiodiplodia mahajangana]